MRTQPDPLFRNNVRVTGNPSGAPMVFVHGFGGNQDTWRFVTPEFEADHRIVTLDLVGAGASDGAAYDPVKYDSFHGYADDLIEIIDELELTGVVLVGHSVSATISILAANRRPELFNRLVLIGPSPRYVNEGDYVGGFTAEQIDDLLNQLDSNHFGWSSTMGPTIMGNLDRPELGQRLAEQIQANDPAIVRQFARLTFLSDNRRDLADVTVPTLVLQSSEDNIAGPNVGRYVHEHIAGSTFVMMESRGHVPNLSHPDEVVRHMKAFLP